MCIHPAAGAWGSPPPAAVTGRDQTSFGFCSFHRVQAAIGKENYVDKVPITLTRADVDTPDT